MWSFQMRYMIPIRRAFAATLPAVQRIEVLPFHRLGAHKYAELGLAFPLADTAPPDAALLEQTRARFRDRGLAVR